MLNTIPFGMENIKSHLLKVNIPVDIAEITENSSLLGEIAEQMQIKRQNTQIKQLNTAD